MVCGQEGYGRGADKPAEWWKYLGELRLPRPSLSDVRLGSCSAMSGIILGLCYAVSGADLASGSSTTAER
eukprot:3066137-Rhodomonas_salina.3